jgi:NADH dehydrogenase
MLGLYARPRDFFSARDFFSRAVSQRAALVRLLCIRAVVAREQDPLMHNDQPLHVVILGAGYAGQMAAARLAQKRLPVRITVVDPSPVFVERIRLHQVAAGQPQPEVPMRWLLPRDADLIQARATRIDTAQRLVHLQGEGAGVPPALRYDVLVYALGSGDDLDTVPGARLHARALGSQEAAASVAGEVPSLAARGGSVVVVGGGLTGIEAAAELAESHPGLRVTLVTAGPLGAGLHERGRAHLATVFDRLGVIRREHTQVVAVEPGRVRLVDGSALAFDLCLWTAGFRVPALARLSGLPCDERGLVEVDPTLRVRNVGGGFGEVFAAGDAAVITGGPALRMACAVAMPMGVHVAEEIARLVRGQPHEAFRFAFAAQCISLGRRDGLVQMVDAEDRPTPRIWRGRKARWLKETICRYTLWMIRAERRGVPLYHWPRPPQERVPALAAAAEERA